MPLATTVKVGDKFGVEVDLNNVPNTPQHPGLAGVDIWVTWDKNLLSFYGGYDPSKPAGQQCTAGTSATSGDLPGGSSLFAQPNTVVTDPNTGQVYLHYVAVLFGSAQGQSGSGKVLYFCMQAAAAGQATISFPDPTTDPNRQPKLLDANQSPQPIPYTEGPAAVVTINSASAALGGASGTVRLQRHDSNAGAVVQVGDVTTTTGEGGGYSVVTGAGTDLVYVTKQGYLPAEMSFTPVVANSMVYVPPVHLLGGDVTGDGRIDLFDLVTVASAYDTHPPSNPLADVNGDGYVDIIDIVLVGANYGKQGVQSGAAAAASVNKAASADKAAPSLAQISLDAPSTVQKGQEFKVSVLAHNVKNLYGVDVALRYDKSRVQMLDSKGTPGALLGDDAYTITNKAISGDGGLLGGGLMGTYRFAATKVAPAVAANGDGVIVTVTFRAIADGAPRLRLSRATLVDGNVNNQPSSITTR